MATGSWRCRRRPFRTTPSCSTSATSPCSPASWTWRATCCSAGPITAVRSAITHGAQGIKACASGGVMSHTGPAGAQQYSDDELRAVADEAHRAGLKVAAHAHGDDGIRAAIEAGIDCIEHGSLATDQTLQLMVDRGTFLVATTYLADGMDVSHAAPELQAKAAEVFPRAKATITKAIERGAKVACGTDAPAIPHGRNAKELVALVDRGMTPLQAIRAATTV